MKITIEPYSGGTFSGETEAEHIEQVAILFKGILVAAGYHPRTADELFDTEEKWYTQEEINLYDNYKDMKVREYQESLYKDVTS
jgi:hypothetical protein